MGIDNSSQGPKGTVSEPYKQIIGFWLRAFSCDLAFGGGNFVAEYNDDRTPFKFTPPEDASRVEIVSIIGGHGQRSFLHRYRKSVWLCCEG